MTRSLGKILLHADFEANDFIIVTRGGSRYTARQWLKTTMRMRIIIVIFAVVWFTLFGVTAIVLLSLGITGNNSEQGLFVMFGTLSLFVAWYTAAALIWMYNNRTVPARQITSDDVEPLTPQWDVVSVRPRKLKKIKDKD